MGLGRDNIRLEVLDELVGVMGESPMPYGQEFIRSLKQARAAGVEAFHEQYNQRSHDRRWEVVQGIKDRLSRPLGKSSSPRSETDARAEVHTLVGEFNSHGKHYSDHVKTLNESEAKALRFIDAYNNTENKHGVHKTVLEGLVSTGMISVIAAKAIKEADDKMLKIAKEIVKSSKDVPAMNDITTWYDNYVTSSGTSAISKTDIRGLEGRVKDANYKLAHAVPEGTIWIDEPPKIGFWTSSSELAKRQIELLEQIARQTRD